MDFQLQITLGPCAVFFFELSAGHPSQSLTLSSSSIRHTCGEHGNDWLHCLSQVAMDLDQMTATQKRQQQQQMLKRLSLLRHPQACQMADDCFELDPHSHAASHAAAIHRMTRDGTLIGIGSASCTPSWALHRLWQQSQWLCLDWGLQCRLFRLCLTPFPSSTGP